MNERSLSHNYVKKQQLSSWIDDPLQLNMKLVKGLTSMSHEKNLYYYAEDLVGQFALFDGDSYNLSLSELPEENQNELLRLYIESIDREIEWACSAGDESINSDFLCSMLSMLKDDTKEAREHFAYLIRNNLLKYYKDSLNKILSDSCDNLLMTKISNDGWYTHQDQENDDVFYNKS